MKSEAVGEMRLYFDEGEREAAGMIGAACARSAAMLRERWGLETPADCRVYVATAWMPFLFHAAPWPWKAYLALVLPMVSWRAGEIWAYAGGWTLRLGRRLVVGVKPPRLMAAARDPGEQFYSGALEANEIAQAVTCRELARAFTFHLRLPFWLREGLAVLAVEHFFERRLVPDETREMLVPHPAQGAQPLAAQYALGYWLTRYIEETRPELLRALLAKRLPRGALEERVAAAFGKRRQAFWREVGEELRAYFR